MTGCLTEAQLERLVRGPVPRVRGWLWRRHLRGCPHCRARYDELAEDRRLVAEIRAALRPPGSESRRPSDG
ncbi:hypothetical protein J0H58_36520 [bacterium]|nr:hypothetical protein [bacterium]